MSTSRTLRLTPSYAAAAAAIAASLALSSVASGATTVDRTHLGTDHLAQSIGQLAVLDAAAISDLTGVHFDIGAVVGLRHTQAAQYFIDHALELSQGR